MSDPIFFLTIDGCNVKMASGLTRTEREAAAEGYLTLLRFQDGQAEVYRCDGQWATIDPAMSDYPYEESDSD